MLSVVFGGRNLLDNDLCYYSCFDLRFGVITLGVIRVVLGYSILVDNALCYHGISSFP